MHFPNNKTTTSALKKLQTLNRLRQQELYVLCAGSFPEGIMDELRREILSSFNAGPASSCP